jgi:hypothetical protein
VNALLFNADSFFKKFQLFFIWLFLWNWNSIFACVPVEHINFLPFWQISLQISFNQKCSLSAQFLKLVLTVTVILCINIFWIWKVIYLCLSIKHGELNQYI